MVSASGIETAMRTASGDRATATDGAKLTRDRASGATGLGSFLQRGPLPNLRGEPLGKIGLLPAVGVLSIVSTGHPTRLSVCGAEAPFATVVGRIKRTHLGPVRNNR